MPSFESLWKSSGSVDDRRRGFNPVRILRVAQLDAYLLDNELFRLLKTQFTNAISLLYGSIEFEPEIELFLKGLLLALTKEASYGMEIQNLQFTKLFYSNKSLRFYYFILEIFFPYTLRKIINHALNHDWSQNKPFLWKLTTKISHIFQLVNLINFLLFLNQGKYASVTDRLLDLTMEYKKKELSRIVDYEYMNRELVWSVLTVLYF